ncbi:transcription factor E2F6-like isoform X2 [Sminthopsis crassicaudata]|uniref:transcription factor E2F6-like isoform X2 n=1 Tax=Sminthopsis crassicaudata TaxID=9301 RepID=UPI003D69163C
MSRARERLLDGAPEAEPENLARAGAAHPDPRDSPWAWDEESKDIRLPEIKNNLEENISRKKASKTRYNTSLCYYTRKFMDLLKAAPSGVLHLKEVATILGVKKRRVYDITNVLHGIKLIQKRSKNCIQWIGSDLGSMDRKIAQQKKLRDELSNLSAMEDTLDELNKICAHQLFELADDKENAKLAYVTYEDIHSLQDFHEQIVIAVKAPEETKLNVLPPKEDSITVHIKSTKGPIDVYLCEMKQENTTDNLYEDTECKFSEN